MYKRQALTLNNAYKPYALNNRGNAYRLLKQYDKAMEDINNSMKIDSLNAWAFMNRALVYEDQKQYDKALVDYNRAAELNSQLHNIYFHRANYFMNRKQYDKALTDYNKLQELAPDFKAKEIEKNKKAAKKEFLKGS